MVAKPELKFIVLNDVESVLAAKGTMILVALNLFCLGYCRLFCRPEAVFWVDGVVGKWFLQLKGVKVEKVPGVELLEQAMSSGLIDRITIFGSCSDEFRDLCNKRRIKIVYEQQLLDFDLNNFVLPKDATLAKVVIIALPSPKQELLAFEISQKLKSLFFQICERKKSNVCFLFFESLQQNQILIF